MNHIKTKIMKTISKLKSVLVLMVFAAAIFSCSDSNETDYTGVNSIYVRELVRPCNDRFGFNTFKRVAYIYTCL